tara:strand:+ start:863 stop:1006 length:144 start_codon:yes stop_codon:yes gene_type:complete
MTGYLIVKLKYKRERKRKRKRKGNTPPQHANKQQPATDAALFIKITI